jgi:hypothetical protein
LAARAARHKPVLFVAGNHEYYARILQDAAAKIRDAARGTNVTFLDADAVPVVEGVRKDVLRPASSWKASKMPKVDGPSRRENQATVAGSLSTICNPFLRNSWTATSFPGFASMRTNNATVTMVSGPSMRRGVFRC